MKPIIKTVTAILLGAILLVTNTNILAASTVKPVIKVDQISRTSLVAGETYDIEVTLKNVGNYTARNVEAALLEQTETPLNIETGVTTTYMDKLEEGKTIVMKVRISVDKEAKAGVYPIKVTGKYAKLVFAESTENTNFSLDETINFTVIKTEVFNNLTATVEPVRPLIAGQAGQLSLKLSDNSGAILKDVKVTMLENPTAGIKRKQDGAKTIDKIYKETVELKYDVLVDKEISGYLPVKFKVEYTDGDVGLKKEQELLLYAYVQGGEQGNLVIKSLSNSAYSVSDNSQVTVNLVLENTKDVVLKNVQVIATPEKGLIIMGQSAITIPEFGKGQKPFYFKVKAAKDLESGNYPINFKIVYEEGKKEIAGATSVYVNKTDTKNESVPRMVIDSFRLGEDKIYVGTQFNLELVVKNASNTKQVNNLKLMIEGVGEVKALLPIDKSSSTYIGKLGPNETYKVTIPYQVVSDINGGVYELNVNFEYEDASYKALKDVEKLYLPIYQQPRLEASDAKVVNPTETGYSLRMDFYNTGKVDIKNLMVDIKGDFETTNSKYYVGDFKVSKMDVYEVQIIGKAPEKVKGTIVFRYDDTFGKEIKVEKPFEATNPNYQNAQTSPNPEAEAQAEAEAKINSGFGFIGIILTVLPILLVLAVIGGVIYYIIRKRRKAK